MNYSMKKFTYLTSIAVWLFVLTTTSAAATEVITYYHTDGLGSVVAASNAEGAIIWKEAYKPYGNRIIRPTTENSNWYAGHAEDKETGLTYMGARWYDPILGRFLGIDPAGIVPENHHSFNRYTYANNNPYLYIDPNGELAFLAIPLAFIADIFFETLFAPDVAFDSGEVQRSYVGFGTSASILKASGVLGASVVAKSVGSFSASARNGVGQVFSPNVTISGKNIIFNDFAIGTQRGFLGIGTKGAAELVGPMKELINFSQKNGANSITLRGKYATKEGAALGGGMVGESFSFTFPATQQGFRGFLGDLRK